MRPKKYEPSIERNKRDASAPSYRLPRSSCVLSQHAVVGLPPARPDHPAIRNSSDRRRGWAQLRHLAPHSTQCGSPMYPVGRPSHAMVTAPWTAASGAAAPPTRRNHSEPHSQRAGASVVRRSRAAARSRTTTNNLQSQGELMNTNRLRALGPDGTFKTGQRVPFADQWVDQYHVITTHEAGGTFPPCIGRKGECAFRRPWVQTAATA